MSCAKAENSASGEAIGKSRLNSRIESRMYVKRSTMNEKSAFY